MLSMLSKRAARTVWFLSFAAGLAAVAISFTVYALTGRTMTEALAWLFWIGVLLLATSLAIGITNHFRPDDEAVATEPSGNAARRNRRNRQSGKR